MKFDYLKDINKHKARKTIIKTLGKGNASALFPSNIGSTGKQRKNMQSDPNKQFKLRFHARKYL